MCTDFGNHRTFDDNDLSSATAADDHDQSLRGTRDDIDDLGGVIAAATFDDADDINTGWVNNMVRNRVSITCLIF